jgi:hypothetical protein
MLRALLTTTFPVLRHVEVNDLAFTTHDIAFFLRQHSSTLQSVIILNFQGDPTHITDVVRGCPQLMQLSYMTHSHRNNHLNVQGRIPTEFQFALEGRLAAIKLAAQTLEIQVRIHKDSKRVLQACE